MFVLVCYITIIIIIIIITSYQNFMYTHSDETHKEQNIFLLYFDFKLDNLLFSNIDYI